MHPNPFLSSSCCTSFTTFYLLICFFQTKKEEGGKDKASIEDSAFEALEKDFQDVRIFCFINDFSYPYFELGHKSNIPLPAQPI